jgi:ribosome-binding ATPase
MELVEKRLERIAKEKRSGQTPQQVSEERTLRKCMQTMESGQRLDVAGLGPEDRAAIPHLDLLTLLPVLTAYNVDEDAVAKSFGPGTLTVSAKIEQEITAIENPEERREYLTAMGLQSSGLDRMNAATYDALGLMSFYTVGKDEVRAWTIRKGATAPEAGGKIHTDIARGFIRVEVIKYDDLVAAGSEQAARSQGKVQTKGRDYVMQDGDICHFLFNV